MVDIGIEKRDRVTVADGLKHLLADSYALYLQTQYFHWNVTGARFRDLHLAFEEQYGELAVAIDDIAERIRSLGIAAPGSMKRYLELTRLKETFSVPDAEDMVTILLEGHESIVRSCRDLLPVANGANDDSSTALISDRMKVHEKTAWMLRAMQD